MNNCEDTLATDPLSISALDSGIMKHGSLIKLNPTIVDMSSERYLVGVEVFEA
jgi:hypothetical protein